jgi:hypothetical protein
MYKKILGTVVILLGCVGILTAQEMLLPLSYSHILKLRSQQLKLRDGAAKPTALTIPFFEDFTDEDPYPNTSRWVEPYVYVNNTMGKNPISRGVATFDALNEKGGIYFDTITSSTQIVADTLTSLSIDLSTHQPSDSLYLSFYYQTKGYGFSPRPEDSLTLYFLKSNGVWEQVWAKQGAVGDAPFRQVMIPVTDTGYFNDNFKMRWMNRATKSNGNSNWHLDYILLDANRHQFDTIYNDIAYTQQPANMLKDYTSMPFSHFRTNVSDFLKDSLQAFVKNNGSSIQNFTIRYSAKELITGTVMGNATAFANLNGQQQKSVKFPMYNTGSLQVNSSKVVFENTFNCSSVYPNESKVNDTIKSYQVFDNYLAYDDGTAEQSYFLNLFPNAPGEVATEFALYHPDTLRGVAIRFATEQPSNAHKEFVIKIYKNIGISGVGGTDDLIYETAVQYPNVPDSINKLAEYIFDEPVLMDPGAFYVSIMQTAGGISDSLQIALDANRDGANHRYYRTGTMFESSLLDGALLVRPLLGKAVAVGLETVNKQKMLWDVSPNPAHHTLQLNIHEKMPEALQCQIVDVKGQLVLHKSISALTTTLDIASLPSGVYFVQLLSGSGYYATQKIVKQ